MLADGLIDELHLFVYPLTRGYGPRIPAGSRAREPVACGCGPYENGVVYLAYRPQA